MHEDEKQEALAACSCHTHICAKFLCIAFLMIVLAGIASLVMYLLFKPKDAEIKIRNVEVEELDVHLRLPSFKTNITVVLHMDLIVTNPNRASFRYTNTTVNVYYHGVAAGQAPVAASELRAKKTENISTHLIIDADTVLGSPYLTSDLRSGIINLTTKSTISGRINVWNILKHHLESESECKIILSISSRTVAEYTCNRSYELL